MKSIYYYVKCKNGYFALHIISLHLVFCPFLFYITMINDNSYLLQKLFTKLINLQNLLFFDLRGLMKVFHFSPRKFNICNILCWPKSTYLGNIYYVSSAKYWILIKLWFHYNIIILLQIQLFQPLFISILTLISIFIIIDSYKTVQLTVENHLIIVPV